MDAKKQQKYDRQLRLWQGHGQASLEAAKICLLNGSATGTELLKNLILPGIGSFTIVDESLVSEQDLENNFFLTRDSLGKSRAEQVTEYLRELNEDVNGSYLHRNPITLIEENPEFFMDFDVVLATEIPLESTLLALDEICQKYRRPLMIAQSYGFLGYLRVCGPEHTVVETHPENAVDLRLDCPWKELTDFVGTFQLEKMDSFERSHVPYAVLLLLALDKWKQQHQGSLPATSADRAAFKASILEWSPPNAEEENFTEATAAAFRACIKTTTPSFWILVKALGRFIEEYKVLPLAGSVPDMKASTDRYVQLQTIYRNKAQLDVQRMRGFVDTLLDQVERPRPSISDEELQTFCKNAAHLKVLRYRPLSKECCCSSSGGGTSGVVVIAAQLLEDQEPNMIWYVLFRAVRRFHELYKRYPGEHDEEVETDIPPLKKCVTQVLSSLGIQQTSLVPDDYIHEMSRQGAVELHNLAAMLGGIGAQECLKLITKQYTPLNNTLLLNGMKSTTSVWEL